MAGFQTSGIRLTGAAGGGCVCSRIAPPTTTCRTYPPVNGLAQDTRAMASAGWPRTFQTALPMMVPRSGGTLRAPSMVVARLSRRLKDMAERIGSPDKGPGRGRELKVLAINKRVA